MRVTAIYFIVYIFYGIIATTATKCAAHCQMVVEKKNAAPYYPSAEIIRFGFLGSNKDIRKL